MAALSIGLSLIVQGGSLSASLSLTSPSRWRV
jgi:hypothetical protein